MLPKEVIDEIRLGTDLVKLVGEVVSLKRSGTNYAGRCPFHEEKSPSFSVSPSKQLYHCFGCGEGGTAITFMMKYYHLPFMDALQRLADRLRIDLTKYQQKQNSHLVLVRKKMMDVISYASQKYNNALSTSFGKEAVNYLSKKRGLTNETISEFQLGFAPEGWDHMLKAMERDKIPLDIAQASGILAKRQKGQGLYDVFRNRIMIPIKSPKGDWVGFGGRTFGDEQPKYLNSPQSEIFDKGKLLFGLVQAEKSIREKDFAILVEGYFDQIALYQSGFKNVVATLGTAFTEHHAELLKRYTDKIVVVFDGDKAGLAASRRSMGPLLSSGFQATVVRIPDGQDPDVFVREKGEPAFQKLLDDAKTLAEEMIEINYRKENDLQKKALFLEELAEIIQRTKNIYFQEVLLEDFSKKTGMDKEKFKENRFKTEAKLKKPEIAKQNDTYDSEMTLMRLFLEVPEYRERIMEECSPLFTVGAFQESASQWMNQVLTAGDELNASSFIDVWSHEESRSKMSKIFMIDNWEEKNEFYQKTFQDCLSNLKKKMSQRLSAEIKIAEYEGRDKEVQILAKKMSELKKTKMVEQ